MSRSMPAQSRGKRSFEQAALSVVHGAARSSVLLTIFGSSACSQIANLDQFNGAREEPVEAATSPSPDRDASNSGAVDGTNDQAPSLEAAPPDAPDANGQGYAADARGGSDSSGDGYAAEASTANDASDAGDARIPNEAGDGGYSEAGDGGDSDAGDGGSDAGDAAATRWCLRNATPSTVFCRDFDDGNAYAYGFSDTYNHTPDGGLLPSLSSDAFSAPNSLLLVTSPLPPGGTEQELLSVHIPYHATVNLKFALKITNFDPSVGDLSLARIAYDNGPWSISWDLSGTSAHTYENGNSSDAGSFFTSTATAMPALDRWVNVVFAADLTAQTVSLSFDGVSALQGTIAASPFAGNLSLTIGINYLERSTQSITYNYDNLVVEAR